MPTRDRTFYPGGLPRQLHVALPEEAIAQINETAATEVTSLSAVARRMILAQLREQNTAKASAR